MGYRLARYIFAYQRVRVDRGLNPHNMMFLSHVTPYTVTEMCVISALNDTPKQVNRPDDYFNRPC